MESVSDEIVCAPSSADALLRHWIQNHVGDDEKIENEPRRSCGDGASEGESEKNDDGRLTNDDGGKNGGVSKKGDDGGRTSGGVKRMNETCALGLVLGRRANADARGASVPCVLCAQPCAVQLLLRCRHRAKWDLEPK